MSFKTPKQTPEPGTEQQRSRRDRENMGRGLGSVREATNQGREGGRGTGRHGRTEKGDKSRSPRR